MNRHTLELNFGEYINFNSMDNIYQRGDRAEEQPVYYLVAGLVKLEYMDCNGVHFKHYLQPDTVFGIEEEAVNTAAASAGDTTGTMGRLMNAVAMENIRLYKWTPEAFFQATETSHRLAITAIRSLSRMLRIINSEYGGQYNPVRTDQEMPGEIKEFFDPDIDNDMGTDDPALPKFRKIFGNRQILIREGEILDQLFWILRGEVYVTKRVGDVFKVLTKIGKGELLGEMSFFDKALASATVISNGEVEALIYSRKTFNAIFLANPKWIKQLIYSLSKRIVTMVKKLA